MTVTEAMQGQDNLFIIGCDPGPESSALVGIVTHPSGAVSLHWAYYTDNAILAASPSWFACVGHSKDRTFLCYETCGAQGAFVGASTFETAAMGGEIRRAFRPLVAATYAFRPSEWRYALVGKGNAKAPEIYAAICESFNPTGGGKDPYKGTTAKPGPLWALHEAGKGGHCEHLKDAIGVALAVLKVRFRSGEAPEKYMRSY